MKSILYGLLLALVPDLALLTAGAARRSRRMSDPNTLTLSVELRDGACLICSLRRRASAGFRGSEMRCLVDVTGHVIRPLDVKDELGARVAGDREGSSDVSLELELCSRMIAWLSTARARGEQLDNPVTLKAGV